MHLVRHLCSTFGSTIVRESTSSDITLSFVLPSGRVSNDTESLNAVIGTSSRQYGLRSHVATGRYPGMRSEVP